MQIISCRFFGGISISTGFVVVGCLRVRWCLVLTLQCRGMLLLFLSRSQHPAGETEEAKRRNHAAEHLPIPSGRRTGLFSAVVITRLAGGNSDVVETLSGRLSAKSTAQPSSEEDKSKYRRRWSSYGRLFVRELDGLDSLRRCWKEKQRMRVDTPPSGKRFRAQRQPFWRDWLDDILAWE